MTFALTPLKGRCVAIGKGWQDLRFTGLRLSEGRGHLGLRFPNALRGRLKLGFAIKMEFDPDQPADREIRVWADGGPVALWRLGRKRRQWLEVDLRPEASERRGVDLIFEAKEGSGAFWIQQLKVESLDERGWLLERLSRIVPLLERRWSPQEEIRITRGETVRFGKGGKGLSIAARGWALPDESGSTVEAPWALLRFSIIPRSAHPLKVKLLLTGGGEDGVVRLAWESEELASWWLEARVSQWVEVSLPHGASKRDEILLFLRCSERSIGFALREMIVLDD